MKNMKIGKKLILSFIIVAIIASLSGVTSVVVASNINKQYSDALINFGFAQGHIGKAMLMISDTRRATRDIVSYEDAKYVDAAVKDNDAASTKYAGFVEDVKKTLTNDTARGLFTTAETAVAKYRDAKQAIIELGQNGTDEEKRQARIMAVDELDPIYKEVYTAWSDLMTLKVSIGEELSASLDGQALMATFVTIGLCLAAMLIAVIFGIYISKSISRPITLCVDRLNLLANEGDISSPVPDINTKDETGILANTTANIVKTLEEIIQDEAYLLGEMADGNFDVKSKASSRYIGGFASIMDSMRKINSGLSDTLSQINRAANQVSSGSDQVSSGAQALSQGATEQASSVEELAATINEISDQVKKTATNAATASQLSDQSGNEVEASNAKMQQLIDAMGQISHSSQEIGKVIKTIEDIAFQTNILALNAAVEAARAGAAGKGFAVVADEVRNLASKSGEAAKSTTALIEGAIAAVSNGTHLADETANSLVTVVESVGKVGKLINDISQASGEQAQSITQVTQGVDQISSVVQTNSATAEESAAASEELSSQAQLLDQLVSQFKLKKEATESSAPVQHKEKPAENKTAVAPSNYSGGHSEKY